MATFLITVKLPKRVDHDPHNKKTGRCPVNPKALCSDWTGEHHTLVGEFHSIPYAKGHYEDLGYHVTRVEEVR